ncbi:MAG TPA: apolipoprotein N-acyltransferase [Candidatus Dormibacteraeota bacterium]|nr:apolipoprotein N-acyltransferase [Candidatus Dormibacteraeota bacterium]
MPRTARTLGAAAASAVAFALYARVEWPWFALGWCGLVPWLAALDALRTRRGALAAGWLMSVAFTLAVFPWFIDAVAGYAGAPWLIGLLVIVATAPLIQPQFIVHAVVRHLARRRAAAPWHVATVSACAYVGAEWALPKLFADTIGHGFLAADHLRQAADLAGAGGLSFVLLLANDALLAAWRRGATRAALAPLAGIALLIAALWGYGAARLAQLDGGPGVALRAGLVQADISHYDRLASQIGTYDAVRLILDAHESLSTQLMTAARPDFLVWPETVYPTTFGAPKSADGAAFDAEIAGAVTGFGVPLVFGSYDVEAGSEYNAAFVLEPSAAPGAAPVYRKAQLFPFTERVPAWLDRPAVRAALPWLGTWHAGRGDIVLPLRLADGRVLRIAPQICYDAVNPGLAIAAARAGAELIVTLSNDSWFATGGGPRLHLVVSAFRSIETRLWQVRATNTGISAIISPSGERVEQLGVDAHGTLAATVAARPSPGSLMLAWGDWFGPAALVAGLALLAALFAPARRS